MDTETALRTEIVKIDPDHTDTAEARAAFARAGEILRAGGLVAFPTETVYGLGGDATDASAAGKIYAAKGRPSDNPLIVHIADTADLYRVGRDIPDEAKILADRFWPGPLTVIVKRARIIPDRTTGGLDTVAVRFPSHPVAQALIRNCGLFIAAPSANRSGRPSPTMAAHCVEDLSGRVDMIIDGGDVGIGVESSIIDLTGDRPVILRPGYVTPAMLSETLGIPVETDPGAAGQTDTEAPPPKAPGMKYRHYAPRGRMTLVDGEPSAVTDYINAQIGKQAPQGISVAVLAADGTADAYDSRALVYRLGDRENPESVAASLFRVLRQCDADGAEVIYSETFYGEGLWAAVMNRLEKAAGHQIIRI